MDQPSDIGTCYVWRYWFRSAFEAAFDIPHTVMTCFPFLFGKKVSSDVRRDPEIDQGN